LFDETKIEYEKWNPIVDRNTHHRTYTRMQKILQSMESEEEKALRLQKKKKPPP
jgi:hypothetical protein